MIQYAYLPTVQGFPAQYRDFSDLAVCTGNYYICKGFKVWRKSMIMSQIMSKNVYILKM